MKEKETIDWKVKCALDELDRKLNCLEHAKQSVKNACMAGAYCGACILGVIGAFAGAVGGSIALISYLMPEKKAEAYETNLNKSNTVEDKYSGLAKKVSGKTGVDERILLGLIAGGNTMYANDLRKKGYAGIIPLRPEEAGVTAKTLDNDEEQCLMSAAQVFKAVADRQKDKNLEAAVGTFWYREMEEAAKSPGEWTYIDAALTAYNRRADANHTASREQLLQDHESALAAKERIAKMPKDEREFWESRGIPLIKEIKDPALIFACNAAIEAHKRYKAGEEFTWIDLLPVKLAAAIYCSLAYMNGVEFKKD